MLGVKCASSISILVLIGSVWRVFDDFISLKSYYRLSFIYLFIIFLILISIFSWTRLTYPSLSLVKKMIPSQPQNLVQRILPDANWGYNLPQYSTSTQQFRYSGDSFAISFSNARNPSDWIPNPSGSSIQTIWLYEYKCNKKRPG